MPWMRCQPGVANRIQTRGHFFPRAGGVSAPLWLLPTRAGGGGPVPATAGLLARARAVGTAGSDASAAR